MTGRPDESAALRSLRESLTEEGGGHPAEELLLDYADKRSSLATDVVAGIDAHLAQCASCRDEVGVLDSMTIRPIYVTSATQERAERSVWQRVVSALIGPVWRPALALAVLVVLMVPTLRLIGQDRARMLDMVDRHNDVEITVNGDGPAQPSGAIQALNGIAEMKGERPARSEDAAHSTTIVPTIPPAAPSEGAGSVPSTPPPPAAYADAVPSLAPPTRGGAPLMIERHRLAARESESQRRNAFSAQAMGGPRAIVSPPSSPTFDYVPGGRVSIAPDVATGVRLRIKFVRDASPSTDTRSSGATTGEASSGVVLGPTVSAVDVVVIAADGRRNSRLVEVDGRHREVTLSMVEIPLEWLAAGENRVDLVGHEDKSRALRSSFVVMLQRPD